MLKSIEIISITLLAILQTSCSGPRVEGLVESSASPAERLRATGLSFQRSVRVAFPSMVGQTRPSAVRVLAGGGMAVVDGDAGQAGLFTSDGGFLSFLEVPGAFHPNAVASGPGLGLYLLDSLSSTVYRFDATGQLAGRALAADEPALFADICFDKAGQIYVTDQESDDVLVMDSGWGPSRRIGGFGAGSGMFMDPTGLAVDERNHVYVCDAGNARLQILDQWGGVVAAWSLQGAGCAPRPKGIAVDRWGNAFVTDAGCKCLRVLDAEGIETARLEGRGPGLGFLRRPEGLDVDSGHLFVADAVDGEVQVFEILYETYH